MGDTTNKIATSIKQDYESMSYDALCFKWAEDNYNACMIRSAHSDPNRIEACTNQYMHKLLVCKKDTLVPTKNIHIANTTGNDRIFHEHY
jgi:hypothetical protein